MTGPFFLFINALIDFTFFLDLIVNFRTTFFHPRSGKEVFKPKVIAKNYLKTRFLVDFLATFPFD
jgi:hypothetical protein